MSVPTHKRNIAKREALKQAKMLEQYTIKKVCSYKNFWKKRYRSFLSDTLVNSSISCYNNLIKAFETPEKALEYLHQAYVDAEILNQQLDTANSLYESQLQGVEYWSELIVELQKQINLWVSNIKQKK